MYRSLTRYSLLCNSGEYSLIYANYGIIRTKKTSIYKIFYNHYSPMIHYYYYLIYMDDLMVNILVFIMNYKEH